MTRRLLAIMLIGSVMTSMVRAEIYELPPDGYDVIGAVSTVTARYEDTLVDIARRHGLGYEDIVRANPDVNVWVGPRRGVVLNLAEYRMYYYPEPRDGEPAYVMTYPISIGRMDWETPLGLTKVISKVRNPAWYPPESVREEHAADGNPLPKIVPPARAMKLNTGHCSISALPTKPMAHPLCSTGMSSHDMWLAANSTGGVTGSPRTRTRPAT